MEPLPAAVFAAALVDRATLRRADAAWLDQARGRPAGRLLRVRDAEVEVDARGGLVWRPVDAAAPGVVLLGLAGGDPGRPVFAVDVTGTDARSVAAPAVAFAHLRDVAAGLDGESAAFAATAVGLLGWHRRHGWCPACGCPTVPEQAGHVRRCPGCDALHFPRTDPAVLMHVAAGDRCVLGRRHGAPPDRWSTMAGFVEVGESLEHAVAREVHEETGLTVTGVRYEQSQPWPFPCSLMVGFTAEVAPGELAGDDEHAELRWFGRDELGAALARGEIELPPPMALGRVLVERWLGAGDGAGSISPGAPRSR